LGKRAATLVGPDISNWQADLAISQVKQWGASFMWMKATEGTTYKSPSFSKQWAGANAQGLLRGSYHFALPNKGPAADQAKYFLSNGGGWTADGQTLPAQLDIEYNPYKATDGTDSCYGLSNSAMVAWIKEWIDTYQSATTRYPFIYTTKDWWTTCTGNAKDFSSDCPLWLAGNTDPPGGWTFATIKQ
ncbi:glycoside hydrolase, partial [Meredithblackwellia eburnea MCA 4105]